mmetsp:Transcript_57847/g.149441  ORF Transcript_57847/g.149441 Transcript_57847/m.149441 type:complete len:373 (-) Transcript_57847:129-1247(-)
MLLLPGAPAVGMPRRWPIGALSIFVALLHPTPTRSQFGGGGGGYNPPAPICPAFKCPSGEKAVGKVDHKIWSYGCKDSGMNVFNAGSFDPNNPMGGMQQKSVDKCCVERDLCKQTCGMTSKMCHDNFQKCSTKICKGDQNCQLQAMMSEMMSEPYEDVDKDKKYDPEATKCRVFNKGQADSCMCVPKDDFKGSVESKLKSFYSKFNSEKLDSSGDIKDVDEVWKKWKGKEADMFLALATKYKAKAVEIRQKPKPPPYEPPPKGKAKAKAKEEAAEEDGSSEAEEASSVGAEDQGGDSEEKAFEKLKAELEKKKKQAKQDEDYDKAGDFKEELDALTKSEVERLKKLKSIAVEEEKYVEAKRIKQRLNALGEL